MPVRSDVMWLSNEVHFFDDFDNISTDDLLSVASLPSEDIWKKFEIDLPLSTDFSQSSSSTSTFDEEDLELDAVLEWSLDATNPCNQKEVSSEIRHHDCMWAGHCGSKEHKPESVKISRPLLQTNCSTPQKKYSSVFITPNSRSLLLTSRNNNNNNNLNNNNNNNNNVKSVYPLVGPRPDSPPSSDDDDRPTFKHEVNLFDHKVNMTLQFLNDAISECDFEEDSDLCDYFEDNEVFIAGETTTHHGPQTRLAYATETDHSYHKGKGAQLRTDHLGVQTPSDSEEEIDVVSVGEKQITTARSCTTVLPTNPSVRDRQKLQRTVASAISNKREQQHQQTQQQQSGGGGGIKTRLPLRIPNTNVVTTNNNNTVKKRQQNNATDNRRGVKRARHHRYTKTVSSGTSRKRYGGNNNNSSDSDTECSEKRSLHNNMERQRRVDLRNAFDDLRVLVPEVSCKERAAKVVILREAAAYCHQLTNEYSGHTKQVVDLRRQQERLRARVSQLRRSLAAHR